MNMSLKALSNYYFPMAMELAVKLHISMLLSLLQKNGIASF